MPTQKTYSGDCTPGQTQVKPFQQDLYAGMNYPWPPKPIPTQKDPDKPSEV